MAQNWDWLGYIFFGMFALGALIIFIALIMTVIWFMMPSKKRRHRRHR